jgi:hypothetical protein
MVQFALAIYVLCALTSLACAALLLRGFRQSGARLLLWSGLCFVCFGLNNVLLVVDVHFVPEHDLSVVRSIPSIVGIALLIYGLVWDSGR